MPSFLPTGSYKIVTSFVQRHLSKIKRKPVFWFLSLAATLFCSYYLYLWTSVPVYTHVFAVDHPFSTDTTTSHYVLADIRLTLNDAFTLQDRNDNPYQYNDRFAIVYETAAKKAKTSIPKYPTPDRVNQYLNDKLFGEGRDTISHKMNLSTYIHMFCSDVDEIMNNKPTNKWDRYIHKDEDGKKHPYYFWEIYNEASIYSLQFYNELLPHLKYVPFFRDIQTLVQLKMVDSDDEPIDERSNLEQNRELSNWEKLKILLSRNHDVSKARYLVFYQTTGVDTTSLNIIFNENVEFSGFSGGGNPVAKRDRVTMSFVGDQTSDDNILTNTFHVRFLESQNAQDLRIMILTTLLAFSLVCLLKITIEYLLKWYSKLRKQI